MDDLSTIIATLDDKDRQDFTQFIQRNRRKSERKDLALFEAIRGLNDREKPDFRSLGLPNRNAYHAVRRRLYEHLNDFILLRSVREDESSMSKVDGMISVARHLRAAGSHRVAWKQLKRAEQAAQHEGLYNALNTIYLLQIEMASAPYADPLDDIIAKYEANKKELELSERISIVRSAINTKVEQFKSEGRDVDLKSLMDLSIGTIELREQLKQRPKLLAGLLQTVRRSATASKAFHAFEPLVQEAFDALDDRSDHYSNAQILYTLAHAQYRNKRFAKSEQNLAHMEEALKECSRTARRPLEHQLIHLRAGNLLLLERVEESIHLLTALVQDRFLSERGRINAHLNLVIYHFFHQQHKKALSTLGELHHSHKWYRERMGIEWTLKRDMIELLLFHELDEPDLVQSRIRSIKRKYRKLFQQKLYARVPLFLSFVKEYVENETHVDLQELEEKMELNWTWVPKEEEDLQAMMFYAWFKSKLTKGNLYRTVLDLVASG
jgi:hypothetical protein